MLQTHDNGASMWVPTLYQTSFEEVSAHANFVATDGSAQMLPQLVRYLQQLEEDDNENVPSSSTWEQESRPSRFSCSRNNSPYISFQASSSLDTENVQSSDEVSGCINTLPGQSFASPSQNRTSWFKSPLLQDFLEKQGVSFEPPRYLGAPELITLQRETCTSRSKSQEPFEEEKIVNPVQSGSSNQKRMYMKPQRAASRSARGRCNEGICQPFRREQQCRQFTTQDLSSLYKQAINNIASELKLKIKELNEKTDNTNITNTPTSFTNLSTRSRMKSCQFASPGRQEAYTHSEYSSIPLQSQREGQKIKQGRTLAKAVKVFQQHENTGFRTRGSPINQNQSQEGEITNQFIFLKMIPQEESKSTTQPPA